MERKVLITDCADAPGLITKITGICFAHGLNIIKNSEFVDNAQGRFFMRTELEGQFDEQLFLQQIDSVLPAQSHRRLVEHGKKRVVIMVTKEAHCLGDLLMKSYYGGLDIEIAAIIGNYDVLAPLADKFDIPFHYVDHNDLTRHQHEQKMLALIADYQPQYIILAKYMRVLTLNLLSNTQIRS